MSFMIPHDCLHFEIVKGEAMDAHQNLGVLLVSSVDEEAATNYLHSLPLNKFDNI